MKIETEKELAALLFGLYLGKSLDMVVESSAGNWVTIGDFDMVNVTFSAGSEMSADSHDDSGWLAVEGALTVAQREASSIWQEWQKANEGEGEAEPIHKAMDYAPEFKEAIRRIDAGEPVNTTAAELGLTPKELLDVIGGALQ